MCMSIIFNTVPTISYCYYHCFRKRGIIVNVASSAVLSIAPLLNVYTATKVMDHMMHNDIINSVIVTISFL